MASLPLFMVNLKLNFDWKIRFEQKKKSSKNATHTVKLLLKKDQRNASEKVAKAYKSKRPITIILHI